MNGYKLIDSGDTRRLEDWSGYIIDRPDPEAMWEKSDSQFWNKASAYFKKEGEKGKWITKKMPPHNWTVDISDIKFLLRLSNFKHTGVFPEQEWQWKLIQDQISKSKTKKPKILNLFGYTGGASIATLKAGGIVTHVDASYPAIDWFNQNLKINNLEGKARIIVDDVLKFVEREVKRGSKYEGVIMDPPVYGHGPKGEKWDFNKNLLDLLKNISKLTNNNPLFVIVNAYAVSTSHQTLKNIMSDVFKNTKDITSGELYIQEQSVRKRILTTGKYAVLMKV